MPLSMQEVLGAAERAGSPGLIHRTTHSTTVEEEAGSSEDRGHLQLLTKLKVSLGYTRPCLKKLQRRQQVNSCEALGTGLRLHSVQCGHHRDMCEGPELLTDFC